MDEVERLRRENTKLRKMLAELSQQTMPRLRDLQGETQTRFLNDWATTSHVFEMGIGSFLAHIPDAISRQQFDGDAWQRLSEVEVALQQVARAIEDMKRSRDVVSSEGGEHAVV